MENANPNKKNDLHRENEELKKSWKKNSVHQRGGLIRTCPLKWKMNF